MLCMALFFMETVYISNTVDIYNYINKNNKKTFSIKIKEDVGMSNPKKHANKVGKLTQDPKSLPYNHT